MARALRRMDAEHRPAHHQTVKNRSSLPNRPEFLGALGAGLNAPDDVAYMGNFHPVNVSPEESWVTDGEIIPKRGWKGDLMLARIRWTKPNLQPSHPAIVNRDVSYFYPSCCFAIDPPCNPLMPLF